MTQTPAQRFTHCGSRAICLVAWVLLSGLLAGCRHAEPPARPVRVATYNTALSRDTEGALHAAFATGQDAKARLVAEVLQRTRPDIVLLQEIDYDPTGKAYADFQRRYLGVAQNGAEPIRYEYVYAPPVNTGVLAEVDLDGDGKITRPNDCYGYGLFEGHYGMVVLSRYPIDTDHVKDLREKRWVSLPDQRVPEDYYSDAARSALRLSSKTHADVRILLERSALNLWISHPTPPAFDGPEDRNGRRNADEIALWNWYYAKHQRMRTRELRKFPESPSYLFDHYIIMGDLNADPNDGSSRRGAIQQLIDRPWLNDVVPTSRGGAQAARLQAGANLTHKTDPAADTADFGDTGRGPGNLRVDYVLPSANLDVVASGVYWPTRDDPHAYLNKASDHKLVWIDIALDDD
ncbi:MAG: endonuclease/exonuclease/phosphatase family protein [Phycisphaeraceae bacterium]